MDFVQSLIEKSKKLQKTIVLPETEDDRVLKAAAEVLSKKIAKLILIGNKGVINKRAGELGISLDGALIEDPAESKYTEEFIDKYFKAREKKGVTLAQATEIMTKDKMFFGSMLVNKGLAHGLVGGALNTTAHTLRAMIHCVGVKPGFKNISSFFIMVSPNKSLGSDGILLFGDCAVIPNPDPAQLADIAEATAANFNLFTGGTPNVAFLSFSTKGSADTDETKKVVAGYEMLKAKRPDLNCDGELQLDAAIVPEVGSKKSPGSKVAGKANVLIFPTLDAGNIGYKLAQRFGNCIALGPILQGASRPVNDLSRGCSVEDIVNVVAITSVQE